MFLLLLRQTFELMTYLEVFRQLVLVYCREVDIKTYGQLGTACFLIITVLERVVLLATWLSISRPV